MYNIDAAGSKGMLSSRTPGIFFKSYVRHHPHNTDFLFIYIRYSNQEVIAMVRGGELLAAPAACPPTMYQLMRDCWKHTPQRRPNFDEIVNRYFNVEMERMEIFFILRTRKYIFFSNF